MPAVRGLVLPRVLDCDCCLRCEQLDQVLVLFRELVASLFLSEVEIPVRNPAQQDRNPEKRPHRRVVCGKADGARIAAEVGEPEWRGLPDEHAEDPPPSW